MNYLTRFQIFSRLQDIQAAHTLTNYAYLRRCAWLSVVKRWGWIAAVAALCLLVGLASSVGAGLLAGVLGAAGTTVAVALHSVLRHRSDPEARTDLGSPFLRRL